MGNRVAIDLPRTLALNSPAGHGASSIPGAVQVHPNAILTEFKNLSAIPAIGNSLPSSLAFCPIVRQCQDAARVVGLGTLGNSLQCI